MRSGTPVVDTVNFDPRAVELAIAFASADHILAGSDYPHQIGSIPKMLGCLKAIRVSEDDSQEDSGCERRTAALEQTPRSRETGTHGVAIYELDS